jgi:CHAD domain-containing protein
MQPADGPFRLASRDQAREVLDALGAAFSTGPPQRAAVGLHYLDTFDWRVFRSGGRLAAVKEGSATVLAWEPQRGGRSLRCAVDRAPEFAWDLPDGVLRQRLTELIDVRRLLPVVALRLDCRQVTILDRRHKTVARVRTESGTVADPGTRRGQLSAGSILRIEPVKGYPKEYRALNAWVVDRYGLQPTEPCTMTRALAILGRRPAESYKKPGYDIATGMRGDAAMKSILQVLLERMLHNEEGARDNTDTEYLHDFRVAVRRTRSALGQVPEIFPRRILDRYRSGFAWLGDVTNPVRDLDVQLLGIAHHRLHLPQRLHDGLNVLERMLRREHRTSHRRMVSALNSQRYRRLVESWRAYLEQPAPERTSLANAARPVERVAEERIRRAHRRVLKKGKAIDDDSPPRRLHRLRIECKKLRYLLEFFAGLYPADKIRPLIGALKKLQTNLGDLNDYAVEQAVLAGYLERLPADGTPAVAAVREAIPLLIEQLRQRQTKTRKAFQDRFDAFSGKRVVAGFRDLFGSHKP